MKIDIVTKDDDNFKLLEEKTDRITLNDFSIVSNFTENVPNWDNQVLDTVVEPKVVIPTPNAAPVENIKNSNSFNIFEGTTWEGGHQRPGDIGR